MRIGIVGAGRVGGGIARQLAGAQHEIKLSFSHEPSRLEALAGEIRAGVSAGTPRAAVEVGEVVVISVPWAEWPNALEQMGSLEGKIVIDTTNQFGPPPLPADGETAALSTPRGCPGRCTRSRSTL
jgi:8-hydroxy-5-deazaflavin:NADPH oxidoreductase